MSTFPVHGFTDCDCTSFRFDVVGGVLEMVVKDRDEEKITLRGIVEFSGELRGVDIDTQTIQEIRLLSGGEYHVVTITFCFGEKIRVRCKEVAVTKL